MAAPQLGSCAPSGRAWRLWAARYSQGEAQPLGAQPPPRGLKRAASKVANLTAVDPSGVVFYLDTDFKSEQNRFTTLDVLEVTRGP